MNEHTERILRGLEESQPLAKSELEPVAEPTDLLQTLVAVILSAQCLDSRVNVVVKTLFDKLKIPQDYVDISQGDLEKLIGSITYFRTKAKNIKKTCEILIRDFGGQVPMTYNELTSLPGVGPKTANVVLGHMGIVNGFVVDTHVGRIAFRLGLSKHTNPNKIRQDLEALMPKEMWNDTGDRMILHGRYICKARTPLCEQCLLEKICPKCGL